MTPDARAAAAIEVLDQIIAGTAAQKALTNWARRSRFAGSKDRAAVRDICFDCLRRFRSHQRHSGFTGARAAVLGSIVSRGKDAGTIFTGLAYGPTKLTKTEREAMETIKAPSSPAIALDVPDWLEVPLRESLKENFEEIMESLRHRARIYLRMNEKKTDLHQITAILSKQGVTVAPVQGLKSALIVTQNPRRVAQSDAYQEGLVEIQDAGSQKVVDQIDLPATGRVLDYCAGGGGKSLAMASGAGTFVQFTAWDASSARMKDLPARAQRAGVKITIAATDPCKTREVFDLVVLDVPCSGSGAWRRNPDGKWKLTPNELDQLLKTQAEILQNSAVLTAPKGQITYITCSLLRSENEDQIHRFLKNNREWAAQKQHRISPLEGGDGFFLSTLTRN